MSKNKLTIVVPSYNEAKNVVTLVAEIEKKLRGINYEVLFVDDSTDNTPNIIQGMADVDEHVRLFHRENEKGLATAVLKGFELADGDIIAVMDADLQHPPEILRGMYAAIMDGADMCIPSRYIPGGSDGGLNLFRKFVSATARYIGKILLPCLRKITDPTSGLFMFKKEILNVREEMKPIGWKIMIEVLAITKYKNVVEIPYSFCDRQEGESKLSSKVTFEYLKQVVGLMKRGKKRKGVVVEKWSIEKMNKEVQIYFKNN